MEAHDPEDLARLVGARVAELRRERGMTQQALASTCKFGLRYVQRLERSGVNVTLATLAKLANAFAVEVVTLLTPPGEVTRPRRGRPRKIRA